MNVEYVIYGVYILSVLNIILFIFLLINKIIDKKKKKRDEEDKIYYKRIIKGFLTDKMKGVPKPKTRREMSIFKSVLLETFDTNDKNQRVKLLEIAREIGLIKAEIEHLNNSTDARKAIAAYFLGQVRAKEATKDILKNIDTKNKEFLYVICRALVLVSGTEYIDIIIQMLETNDYTMKLKILDLISLIDEEDIYPKMEEYIKGENLFRKLLAFEALGNRKDIRIVPYIEEAIISDEKELKISGLKAIIGTNCMDYKNVMPHIKTLKDDKSWEIRAFSAKALCSCKDFSQDGIVILKEMMEDSNWFVRFNASESLLAIGEAGIIALSETLHSSDQFARDKAWDVLQRELTLYNLSDRIQDYKSCNYILENITNYENSLKGGMLIES